MRMDSDRILIIDDDLDILELLEYNLSREGYEVFCLQNPEQSYSVACEVHPTLIILDAVMPQQDGFSVCRQLRSSQEFATTPIFILTALVESHYEKQAIQHGADDFIHKMLGLRSLTKRIELVLRKKLIIRKREERFQIGMYLIDRSKLQVYYKGKYFKLNPEEFEIFFFIAQNAHHYLTRDHVLQIIGGSNLFQMSISVDRCFTNLHALFGKHWIRPRGRYAFQFNAG